MQFRVVVRHILVLAAICWLAGCGGRGAAPGSPSPQANTVQPPAGLLGFLPPLPPADARATSAAKTGYMSGLGIYNGQDYDVSGNSTVLPAQPNKVSWATFALNLNGGMLSRIEPNVDVLNGKCWVAISNYDTGRWQFLGSLTGPGGFDLAPAQYGNGTGSFFLLLITFNGDVAKHNYTLAYYDDGTAQGATISGTVTDENSLPVGGVYLQVTPGFLEAYTNSQGQYSVSVPADDTYTVEPQQGGYTFTPMNTPVTITGGASVAGIDFQGTSTDIRGTITEGGNPLGGVSVKLQSTGQTTETLPDGTYLFQGVNPGPETVIPKLAGYDFTPPTQVINTMAGDVNGVDFAATGGQPTYRVSGHVLDSVTLTGVPGAVVRLDPDYIFVNTDAAGYYEFTGLAPDIYTVNAFHQGYIITPTDQQAPIVNLDADNIDFSAQQLYQVSGDVKGGGGTFPLAGINVSLMPGNLTTTTDSNGHYLFGGRLPGNYTVTPSHALYTFTPLNQNVVVTNADVAASDFSGALTGTVTYTNTIASIVSSRCLSCHSPQAVNFVDPDLTTYAQMNTWGGSANGDVQGGSMPPGNPLNGQLKEQFQAWFSAGKPQ